MNKTSILILISILTSAIHTASSASNDDPGQNEIETLFQEIKNLPPRLRQESLTQKYSTLYPGEISTANLNILRERFETAISTAFYSGDKGVSEEALIIYNLLKILNVDNNEDYNSLLSILIKSRSFSLASEIIQQKYGKETKIEFSTLINASEDGPAYIKVNKNDLSIEPLPAHILNSGIVIISNPLCGFSVSASNAISNDETLSSALRGALWLVPPEGNLHLDEIRQWNDNNPSQQMVLTYNWTEWNLISDWDTPNFYFFENNRVVAKLTGWPPDGSKKSELLDLVNLWHARRDSVLSLDP
jgi:hypothetical protein